MSHDSSVAPLSTAHHIHTPGGIALRVDPHNLTFTEQNLGPHQRASTWPATAPSERGPQPFPAWVPQSASAIDTELGVVKSGKEADVFLIERGVPGQTAVRLAAKRYRGEETSDFHRSAAYTEGRRTRRTRDARALANRSTYGRALASGQWAFAEFTALSELFTAGAAVPYPVQVHGSEILMEFIGDDRAAAPRLAQQRGNELAGYLEQTIELMRVLARLGYAHGDLSPYNLLVHHGHVVVIDVPQIVDIAANPNGFDFLHRDCVNVSEWFERQRIRCDAEELFALLLGDLYH